MCIVFFHQFSPGESEYLYAFVDNRDEFLDRPSEPAGWWSEEALHIQSSEKDSVRRVFAGRDLSAGGTWFGVSLPPTSNGGVTTDDNAAGDKVSQGEKTIADSNTRTTSEINAGPAQVSDNTCCDVAEISSAKPPSVKLAVLTNYREIARKPEEGEPKPQTRGRLALDYLMHATICSQEAAHKIDGRLYNGFNLILADDKDIVHVSNRPEHTIQKPEPKKTHGLSNTWIDGMHWPKIRIGTERFDAIVKETIGSPNGGDEPNREKEFIERSLQLLEDPLNDGSHDGEVPSILSHEIEKNLTGIHVLPFISTNGRKYATRTSTVVLVRADNSILFHEKNMDVSTGQWSLRQHDIR